MGRLRVSLSALAWSRLGVVVGGLLVVVGVGLAADLAGALITAGILVGVGSLMLIEVEDGKGRRR